MKQGKYYKRVKKLTVTAVILTVILALFYCTISLMDTDTANKGVDFVKGAITSIVGEGEKTAPSIIEAYLDNGEELFYYGETRSFNIKTIPKNSFKDVYYESESDNCVIDEKGNITFMGTEEEYFKVKVTSKHNPNATYTASIHAVGINPEDTRIDSFSLALYDNDVEISDFDSLEVLKKYYFKVFAVIKKEHLAEFGLSESNNRLPINLEKTLDSDKEIIYIDKTDYITFTEEGQTNLTLSFGAKSLDVKVFAADKGIDYTPKTPLVPLAGYGIEVEQIGDGVYKMKIPFNKYGFKLVAKDDPLYNTSSVIVVEEKYKSLIIQSGNILSRVANKGEVTVYLKSLLNEDLITTVYIEYEPFVPSGINIECNDKISIFDKDYKVNYSFAEPFYYNQGIKIEVLEGGDCLRFAPDSNKIEYANFGKAKIRISSVDYPELAIEKDIEIVLINDIEVFVSKIVGHLLVFFLLGLGTSCIYFVLLRPRKISLLCIFITLIGYSAFTELLQTTTDRGAGLFDVCFNVLCGSLGTAVFFLITFAHLLFIKKLNPEKHSGIINELEDLSYKTVFKRN